MTDLIRPGTPGHICIQSGGLELPGVREMLQAHVAALRAISPTESCHVLDIESLQRPEISFFTAWREGALAGCGAIKAIDHDHAEVKSMRTADAHQRQGVGAAMLSHLINVAEQRGYKRVSLETGAADYFAPARRLYASFGFEECGPFDGYSADENSVFMTKSI